MKSKLLISLLITLLLVSSLTACGTSESEATDIALAHAGFTAEEVHGLHTEYNHNISLSNLVIKGIIM